MKDRTDNGQATVEIALLIPLLALFLLLIVQVAIVVREHVMVTNASRAAARELSVNSDRSSAVSAAHRSTPGATVTVSRPSQVGQYLTVTVSEKVESTLPFIGVVFPEITVSSRSVMRVEK